MAGLYNVGKMFARAISARPLVSEVQELRTRERVAKIHALNSHRRSADDLAASIRKLQIVGNKQVHPIHMYRKLSERS